ncbi:TPA: hypothetical protein ACW0T4_000086 [Morganella morganii]
MSTSYHVTLQEKLRSTVSRWVMTPLASLMRWLRRLDSLMGCMGINKMKNQLSKEDISKIKNNILLNIEDGVFEYIKKYLIKNLSGCKKTDFIDELESKGIYMCGDNVATTLNISKDNITFSLTGEIQLIGDEDVLQFLDQFEKK